MKKKTFLFFFILFMFISSFLIPSLHLYSHLVKYTDSDLFTSATHYFPSTSDLENMTVLRSYNETGAFSDFYITGTYYAWDNTTLDSLYCRQQTAGLTTVTANAYLDLENISTNIAKKVFVTIADSIAWGDLGYTNMTVYAVYGDSSMSIIYSRANTYDMAQYSHCGNLTSGKILDKIQVYYETTSWETLGIVDSYFYLFDLYFIGYLPRFENLTYETSVKQGDEAYFSGDLLYIDSSLNQNITFQYSGSSNINEQILLTDWVGDNKYYKEMTFSTKGTYRFILSLRNTWNVTLSDYYYFDVGDYPQDAYLSLFSNLDGFPLESKDFKIYLGDDEEESLVNFRDYFGNWSQLYTGSVNASLIDNYIKIQANENGLKTSFEDGIAHDTLLHNTLLFEVKVLAATRMVVIYNPDYHEKDYYIDFTSSMANYWYAVEIPFFLFNQYQNITNDWLSEIGFWIKNTTMEISNIRIAKHYNKTFLQESSLQVNMTGSELVDELTSQSYQNSSTLTFTANKYSSNSSLNITDGFNCSGASWENVTIENNDTICLNSSIKNVVLDFDGTDDFIDSGNNASLQLTNSKMRIEAFVNITSIQLCGIIAKGGNGEYGGFMVGIDASGHVMFLQSQTMVAWETMIISSSTISINTLYNITAINDGSNAYLYVNEVLWGTDTSEATFITDSGENVTIGCERKPSDSSNGRFFFGELYNVTLENHLGAEVLKYCLTEGSGSFAIDSSTYYNDGMIDGATWDYVLGNYKKHVNSKYEDKNGYYISNITNFGENVEVFNISYNSTIPTNTSLSLLVSDNSTGDFDNWVNYTTYLGNKTQFIKYKLLLNNTDSLNLPIFYNINFSFTIYTYNLSQTMNITYYTNSYSAIWNSSNIFNIKTNDTSGDYNLSIYKFNESEYFNITFNNTSYESLNFTFDNNTIYDPGNNNTHMLQITGNSSNPFTISINLINLITNYNKTLYSGSYNISLLANFENLYYYYLNNNSLNLDFYLYNGSEWFKQGDLDNSTQWENYDQSMNSTWSHLNFTFSSFENQSFWIREVFETKAETYRLISPENRQNPNSLSFTEEERTLAILDYFNNTLYRQAFNYSSFIDVALPITTISFHNYYTTSIIIEITRGLGTTIEIVVPPESSINLRIFTTSYLLHVRNAELQTLLLTEFSPDSSKNVIFEFGEKQEASYPGTDFYQNIMIYIIIGLIIFIVAFEIYNRVKARKEAKRTRNGIKIVLDNQKKQQKKEELKQNKNKIKEATRKVRI